MPRQCRTRLNFGTAEYQGQPGTNRCKTCERTITAQYYRVSGAMTCPHAFLALTKKHRILVLTFSLMVAFVMLGESVFILIGLGAIWRLFTKDFSEESHDATLSYFSQCFPR